MSGVLSLISMFILSFMYLASPFLGVYYLYYGSNWTRIVLTLILIYQFTMCKRSETFRKIINYCDILGYFRSFKFILDDPSITSLSSNAIIAHHPHGVITYAMAVLFSFNTFFNNYCYLASRMALILAFGGILLRWCGMEGVNAESMKKKMEKGKNVIIIPGGFEEATLTHYSENRLFIKERKGFIKYCLRYGYTIFPSYGFNENKTFYCFTWKWLGLMMNKIKIPGVVFISKYLNLLPNKNVDLMTVIGKGIKCPKIENPKKEQIDYYHELYIEEIKRIFSAYREKAGVLENELKIY